MDNPNSQIVIYKDKNGHVKIDVRFDGNTVWLTQDALASLYDKGRSTITEHIINIFTEGELNEDSVCREFRRTGTDGKEYSLKYYNLELIIAVGYRVKSSQGIAFRKWATERLSEYIVKGFVIDSERLKTPISLSTISRSSSERSPIFALVQSVSIVKSPTSTLPVLTTTPPTIRASCFLKPSRTRSTMPSRVVPQRRS